MLDEIQTCVSNLKLKIRNDEHQEIGQGNSAKAYCLNIVYEILASRSAETVLLDLGCGKANYMRELLTRFPQLQYIGFEPNKSSALEAKQSLSGLNALIVEDFAYFDKRLNADIILSFSVLEHVLRRREYFKCVKENLSKNGIVLMNYDSGHFTYPSGLGERMLNLFAPIFAGIGKEDRYQRFVTEAEFHSLVERSKLKTIESMSFNTEIKELFKHIGIESKTEFFSEWLKFEVKMNELGFSYDDDLSRYIRTRNHILVHDD